MNPVDQSSAISQLQSAPESTKLVDLFGPQVAEKLVNAMRSFAYQTCAGAEAGADQVGKPDMVTETAEIIWPDGRKIKTTVLRHARSADKPQLFDPSMTVGQLRTELGTVMTNLL